MKKVAIIILNYMTWEETIKEAEFVHNVCNVDYEDVLIIDNKSPNESLVKLNSNQFKGYKLIEATKNGGYAAGNNIGLKYAFEQGYDYAWILNNDIILEDGDVLNKMLNIISKDRDIAVINPDIYSPDNYLYNRDSYRPTLYDFTIGAIKYKRRGRNIKDLGGYGYVYRPQGCCMLVDLRKLENVNYMDEHTFLYCEELILAERLLERGYKCACCVTTKVIHNHSYTVKKSLSKLKFVKSNLSSFNYYLKKYRHYGLVSRWICEAFYTMKLVMTNQL